MRHNVRRVCGLAVCALLLGLSPLRAEGDEAGVRRHLDLLRGIQMTHDKAELQRLNTRMDEAWSFFDSHKATALPLIEQELRTATEAKSPDQFFLMDVGFWLVKTEPAHASTSVAALERIDPSAEMVRAFWQELFHFVMKLGASGQETERYLAQVDRIYLPNKTEINFFAAPHLVNFTPDDLLSLTYGVAGESAGEHLCALAAKPGPDQVRIARLLTVACTEQQAEKIAAILQATRDDDVAEATVTALMLIGGPSGRGAVLAYDASTASPRLRDYLKSIRGSVKKVDVAYFDRELKSIHRPKKMSDREVQQALDLMEKTNGADDSTPPIDVFRSKLDPFKVLAQLKRIRAAAFRRKNNHVFEDLPVNNLLINAFQYKCAAVKVK
ncbi:MAG: hypothetical protein JSS11_11610 [Verrucomicrobia bacterium]|nr:hypothetical protein [Verrucomicrobiota bacterium]